MKKNNNNEMTLTSEELLNVLLEVEKPTFTNIVYRVKVRMNKTNNQYFDKVFKTTKGNFFIGGTYEDMVNERMKKEGLQPTFESKESTIGEHVTKCVQFNENHNKFYLQYFTFDNSYHSTEYEFEGRNIDRELFKSFEVKKSETSRQPQEKKHKPKSLMVENIKSISLNGMKYIIEG